MPSVVMYGASWCADCARAKFFFAENNIAYEYHNIDEEPEYIDTVKKYTNGKQTIPVIVFEDTSILIDPTYEQLAQKMLTHLK